MGEILAIVLPVFGLIGIGAAVASTRLLAYATGDALSEFVFVVAIPLLVFRIMATADLASVSAWLMWFAFFVPFAGVWLAGTLLTRRLFGRDARAGLVAGLAAGYGNTTLIGIPLSLAAFGTDGSVAMALIIAVQQPAMMTIVTLLMARAEQTDGVGQGATSPRRLLGPVLRNVLANPIILGLLGGVAWRISGLPLVGLPAELVDRLADVAATLALFAMGMSLRKYGLRGNVAAGLLLTALKLAAMPALVLALATVVGLAPQTTKVAVLAAACPTGVTPFLVAGRFRTGEGLASTTITMSTALGVASVALWLTIVGRL